MSEQTIDHNRCPFCGALGRIEHRLGEVLAETVSTNRYDTESHLPPGIDKMQSSRAQQVARERQEKVDELRRRMHERFPDATTRASTNGWQPLVERPTVLFSLSGVAKF